MGSGCGDVAVAGEGTSVAACDVLVFRKRSVPASFRRLMSSADSLSLSLLLPLWSLLCVVSACCSQRCFVLFPWSSYSKLIARVGVGLVFLLPRIRTFCGGGLSLLLLVILWPLEQV